METERKFFQKEETEEIEPYVEIEVQIGSKKKQTGCMDNNRKSEGQEGQE